jgi:hypothetical protein
MGAKRNAYRITKTLGGRWLEWGGVDWIGVAQDRGQWRVLVKVVMNLQVPYISWK